MLQDFDSRTGLYAALGLLGVAFIVRFVRALTAKTAGGVSISPRPAVLVTSFVATFFDTLGIGSFAPTTSVFRYWSLVRDEQVPGTLNIGYVVPTIAQAFIYIRIVPVDAKTLILMIGAATVGAWFGAGIVSRWPRKRIQLGMGCALVVAASIILLSQRPFELLPSGGNALSLEGQKVWIGLLGNYLLGALMTLGVGIYAPCMVLVYLLGMTPAAAFPIMMGSSAFLMPVASWRFFQAGTYSPSAVVAMSLTGIPAVFIAAFIVKTLPLTGIRWLVVAVVTYTAVGLLRAARTRSQENGIAAERGTVGLS